MWGGFVRHFLPPKPRLAGSSPFLEWRDRSPCNIEICGCHGTVKIAIVFKWPDFVPARQFFARIASDPPRIVGPPPRNYESLNLAFGKMENRKPQQVDRVILPLGVAAATTNTWLGSSRFFVSTGAT